MSSPAAPADEAKRLATVRRLDIVGSDAEERFDRISHLAAALLAMPIAYVSIADAKRIWFKSRSGLPHYVKESPRTPSFTELVISGEGTVVIPNALEDERVKNDASVLAKPFTRFFAGHPLSAPNGYKVGALCVSDMKPREFSAADQQLLADLAHLVQRELWPAPPATVDAPTQLSNRTGFELLGDYVLARCRRLSLRAALLVFRLEGLAAIDKKVRQDVSAHALNDFSWLLHAAFRDTDLVARVGAAEFAVLMMDADTVVSNYALAKLEDAVANYSGVQPQAYRMGFTVETIRYDSARHGTLKDFLQEGDAALEAASVTGLRRQKILG